MIQSWLENFGGMLYKPRAVVTEQVSVVYSDRYYYAFFFYACFCTIYQTKNYPLDQPKGMVLKKVFA